MGQKSSTPVTDSSEAEPFTELEEEDDTPYDFRTDITELQNVLDEVKGLFEDLCRKNNIIGDAYQKVRKAALSPLVTFLEDLIEKARSPVIYLLGRSGHGKSSLINVLTNGSDAEVGHVMPTTAESVEYNITFQGQNTSWKIIDSRGIFESTRASGASSISATEQVEKDLKTHVPDVILYVICCSEVRNLSADLKFVHEMFETMKQNFGVLPPVIIALSKADVFYHPAQWPIEKFDDKMMALEELIDYVAKPLLSSGSIEFLEQSAKYYGCELRGCEPFLYVIPVATLTIEPRAVWNTDRLNELIGSKLPLQAWLHYYKTQKRSKSMRALAMQVVNKMSVIGLGIGAIPIPGISVVFLMPLYVIMVTLVAKLAGKKLSTKSAEDFLRSCSIWQGIALSVGAGVAASFLTVAELLETVLFGVGCVISGPITAGVTYGVGRSAIAYFFDKETKVPQEYVKEWIPPTE